MEEVIFCIIYCNCVKVLAEVFEEHPEAAIISSSKGAC